MLLSRNTFIYLHNDILLIGSRSGPGAAVQEDWTVPVFKFPFENLTEAEIGHAIRSAFLNCRNIQPNEMMKYKDILSAHLQFMGTKTEKDLYKNTKSTSVHMKNGLISMHATKKKSLNGFENLEFEISLPETASDSDIGFALKEVLERCV